MERMGYLGPVLLAAAVAGLLILYFKLLFEIDRKIDFLTARVEALYQDAVNKAERVK